MIKRLWARAYLSTREDTPDGYFDFGVCQWLRGNCRSVIEIASGRRDAIFWDETDEQLEALKPEESYYAVLAMDGDDMGQWLSGAKAPPLLNALASQAQDYFRQRWQNGKPGLPNAEKVKRPLSPGYHASISEALANFSLYCARPIVEMFGGQLLYAGGDDVLAMAPAANALDCAQALQLAFRGVSPEAPDAHASLEVKRILRDLFDYSPPVPGFITLRRSERADVGRAEHLKPNWPLLLMGPAATASVGIAIGHVRSPMQDVIQAARDAEKYAKSVIGKGAFCLMAHKRSGEGVGFRAQWASGVIAVWSELNEGVCDLSNRFAYRYTQLLKPLIIEGGSAEGARYAQKWDTTLSDAARAELCHTLRKQGGLKSEQAILLAKEWTTKLAGALSPRDYLHFWMTWAFVSRLVKPETHSPI
ncbi:MAG: type III-B CRISPR-associated protein Cas10/Cmr2 [Candidatus Omnitrophica bacterium]|nr:type III-B CRISPR-associated protein Cas10/Cmr2 [Candidatus Omnitrophota bacterium]